MHHPSTASLMSRPCRNHPDLKGSQAANRFVKIQEAYEVVTGKRRGTILEEPQQPAKAGSWDFHDWYDLLSVLRCCIIKVKVSKLTPGGSVPSHCLYMQTKQEIRLGAESFFFGTGTGSSLRQRGGISRMRRTHPRRSRPGRLERLKRRCRSSWPGSKGRPPSGASACAGRLMWHKVGVTHMLSPTLNASGMPCVALMTCDPITVMLMQQWRCCTSKAVPGKLTYPVCRFSCKVFSLICVAESSPAPSGAPTSPFVQHAASASGEQDGVHHNHTSSSSSHGSQDPSLASSQLAGLKRRAAIRMQTQQADAPAPAPSQGEGTAEAASSNVSADAQHPAFDHPTGDAPADMSVENHQEDGAAIAQQVYAAAAGQQGTSRQGSHEQEWHQEANAAVPWPRRQQQQAGRGAFAGASATRATAGGHPLAEMDIRRCMREITSHLSWR